MTSPSGGVAGGIKPGGTAADSNWVDPHGALARILRRDDGVALALVSLVGASLIVMAVLISYRALTSNNFVVSDREFEQAAFVAEGVADQGLNTLSTDSTWNTGHTSSQLATYDLIVQEADAVSASQVQATPEGEAVILKPSDDTKVYGVAFMPSRSAANRIIRVIELEYQEIPTTVTWVPDGAILAEGDVKVNGNISTVTDPPTTPEASVHSNEKVELKGGTCTIDGDVTAGGDLKTSGLCVVTGEQTAGADPVPFPDQDTIDAWQAQLLAEAQAGGTIGGISLNGTSTMTVTAPIYVNGNVTLSSQAQLVINGPGTVYVKGNVTLNGQSVLSNGSYLAVEGKFTQSSTSTYVAVGDLTQIGLVSFSSSSDAIKLGGGATGNLSGIAYAPNGGIKATGGVVWRGALVAGPGGIDLGGTTSITYPSGLLANSIKFPGAIDVALVAKREL